MTFQPPPTVKIWRSPQAKLPYYASADAAGFDLSAHLVGYIEIPPGKRALVPTGLYIEIPQGYEGQVRPRSGLAVKHGITVLNAPGTVDSDYRGEIQVCLINHGGDFFRIESGDRIAQMVIIPVSRLAIEEVYELDALTHTERGDRGFGSTGR